ncbi:DNA-formamidopyrimidine glycosylase [Nitrospirales bacterium NOB]|nr:Formamidopyrimidine-DNA glycosylase [Nitrospirota bacterium]MCE7966449.1 DNA-formamidopyrimidine glycosylase [Nitrospira sp. NTP2]MCK6493193.1 DNA-formamidopyrimidine glycosylase [Nitrospira sp.]MDL1890209.1 DNA-formamidopyrimidine glycosylase [Nitrospirales bacterium NOB]MEB2339327.1 DNA-formamidopyrimidine glycosylase [Nitrospirales bacterium]
MPELPEAEVAARLLRERVLGATVRDCWIGRGDIVREGLSTLEWYRQARITAIERKGKSVILTLTRNGQPRFLVAELGMTGLLLFQSVPVHSPQHVHFVLSLEGCAESELRYWNPRRFGRLSLLDREGLDQYLMRRFGPDPLAIGYEAFRQILETTRRRLKPLLMHQQVIAGIGNIYANEILFRAKLHPDQAANRLRDDAIMLLYRTMGEVLREAIALGGSSVRDYFAPDGREGQYKRKHLVYAKAGQPCPNVCGSVIQRAVGERSSFYCPMCQRRCRRSAGKGRTLRGTR